MSAPPADTAGILAALQEVPIVPVIVIDDPADAVPLARALAAGGLRAIEVTLRTPAAWDAIEQILGSVAGMTVAAGTVTRPEEVPRLSRLGVHLAFSPGCTPRLLAAAANAALPLLPGVATASELMLAREHGLRTFKFFPAETMGGVQTLRSWGELFPDVRVCPTGGIDADNAASYLELPNVVAVGGSWPAPRTLIKNRAWDEIERRAAGAVRSSSHARRSDGSGIPLRT
ncbi:MAG: 2-dehydro-3-deoxyphosphogluconate aldolase / (4S)-4-hydroxy-2-oxoglutarate aldolase [Solirubrobacteraceae bacterium]|nr:2-dehydro-3-deoxyphosphogluconate aldolase / (4S)-4-hydroxy-2-oxoglutarate aldolase [Solirubrobacteraceae bacterium]